MIRPLFSFLSILLLFAVSRPATVPVNIEEQAAVTAAAAGQTGTLMQADGSGAGSDRCGWTIMTRKYKPRSTQPTSVMEEFRHRGNGSVILTAEEQQTRTVTELVRRSALMSPAPSFEQLRPSVERTYDSASVWCIAA